MSEFYSKLCRTCLSPSSFGMMFSFQMKCMNQSPTAQPMTIAEMLSSLYLLQTTVTSEDISSQMPEQICEQCLNELMQAIVFKQKCERSEQELRVMIVENQLPENELKCAREGVDIPQGNEVTPENEFIIQEYPANSRNSHPISIISQKVVLLDQDQSAVVEASDEQMEDELIEGPDYEDTNTNVCDQIEEMVEGNVVTSAIIDSEEPDDTNEWLVLKESEPVEHDDEMTESKEETKSMITNVVNRTIRCPDCGVMFVHTRSLQRHFEKFHSKKDADLDEESLEQKSMEDKKNSHSEVEPDSDLKCQKCGLFFAHRKSLNAHIKYNRCLFKSFSCTICQRVFVRKTALVKHMLSHDLSKTEQRDVVMSCVDCSAEFVNAEDLALHMNQHREEQKKHTCDECGKRFNMFSTLKDHLRTHSGEKPYLCAICGRGFSQSTNMKQHMMRHNKTKPFKCDICSASFVSKGELAAHLRKHSGEHPFVCDACGSGFTTSSSLVKHKRIHSGEKPYACDYCPMRFTALGTLKNHRRTHTGERPFACQFCERTFTQKSDMVSHTRIHTGERPYSCSMCGQTFLQSSALKTHQKTHQDRRSSGQTKTSNTITTQS